MLIGSVFTGVGPNLCMQALEEVTRAGCAPGLPATPALMWQLVHAVGYLHSQQVEHLLS